MDDKLIIVRDSIQKKYDLLKSKGFVQTFGHVDEEVRIEFEDVVDKIDHSYLVTSKIKTKNTIKLLFVLNPTGPTPLDSSRLRETYGESILNGTAKKLRMPIYADHEILFNNKYYFKLEIDKKKRKIFILIKDIHGNVLEKKVYWTFDAIKKMIERKIKKIVLVEYETTYYKLDEFYRLTNVLIYEKVNFRKFLEELEQGHIRVYLKIGVYTSGIYLGKSHDHGATFQIQNKFFTNIFDQYKIKNKKKR